MEAAEKEEAAAGLIAVEAGRYVGVFGVLGVLGVFAPPPCEAAEPKEANDAFEAILETPGTELRGVTAEPKERLACEARAGARAPKDKREAAMARHDSALRVLTGRVTLWVCC